MRFYETGGGIVIDGRGRILLLERHVPRAEGLRHEIRLPKGKIEAGETPAQAALREVTEESGYSSLEIIAPLDVRLVSYTDPQGRLTLRREHYFLMRLTADETPIPTPDLNSEEQLFTPRWAKTFAKAIRHLTYTPEKEIMQRAFMAYVQTEN